MREGWKALPLAQVCSLFTDGDWIETKDQSPEGVRLIQTGNVGLGEFKDRRRKARFISEATFKRLNCQEVHEGDCLVSRLPDPVGRSCIVPASDDKMITAVDCTILRFHKEKLIPEFFNYYSQSAQYLNEVEAYCAGATRKRISRKNLGKVPIPLPSLPEQKRIVAILDEAFAGIATAVANTEKNLANARELFESYLNAVVSRGGEGWRRTKLGLEIDLQTGFAFKSKGYTKDVDGIRLLRGDNIIPGGIRWQDHKKWARDDADAYSKYQLAAGDVVLAMDRTWIKSGLKYAQLNDVDLPCLLVQRVARLRAGPRLNSDFLRCLIGSASFTNYVLSIQTGLGVPHISGPQISEFEFFMPPVDEQAAIALSLDDLGSSVGRLEANYETKYAALCELKQSLLQKAFSGELTATPQEEIETALA